MANLEQEDIEIDVEEETPEEETPEGVEDGSEEITYEQALEWKKKAERLDKAEKALVDKKKAEKLAKASENKNKPTDINPRDEVKRLMAEERFYEKNPEAESYRQKIENYQEKGLSLEEAYILASKSDKEVEENRNIYWKWLIRWASSPTEWIKLVTISEYDKMTESEVNKYNDDMKAKYWVVKFK